MANDYITIDNFKGLYLRRDPSEVPLGYLTVADNFVANDGSMQSRSGIVGLITDAAWSSGIYQARPIDVSDNTKWFVLANNAGTTKFYYCAAGVNTVILNPAPTGCSKFDFIRVFNNYIITFHDGTDGLSGVNSYIFNPAIHSVARITGKTAAASAITVTVAGGAGTKNISVGVHVWGVAFETDTGHISAVALAGLVSATHAGQMADLSNIPTGAAGTGTAKRRILVSKVIPNFDGNLLNYELFFLPTGTIADNTTTVLNNVEFYDSELVDSADYLKDLSSSSASYTSVCQYGERFIGGGKYTGGTGTASPHVLDVSDRGKAESLNSTSGFITVDPGYGTLVQHVAEWKGYLVIVKDIGTYITKDNGDEPNTWPVDKVDGSFGCGPDGICRLYAGQPGMIEDVLLILTTSGLKIFNGVYQQESLTKLVDAYYEDLINASTAAEFRGWQIYADPINKYIYISIVTSGTSASNVVLVGDYRHGLTPDTMIWTKFKFAHSGTAGAAFGGIATIPQGTTQAGGGLAVVNIGTDIYKIRTTAAKTDVSTLYDWELTTWYLPFTDKLTKDQFNKCRVMVKAPTGNARQVLVAMGDLSAGYVLASNPYKAVLLPNPLATSNPVDVLQFDSNQQAIWGQFSMKNSTSTGADTRAFIDYIKKIVIYGAPKELAKAL